MMMMKLAFVLSLVVVTKTTGFVPPTTPVTQHQRVVHRSTTALSSLQKDIKQQQQDWWQEFSDWFSTVVLQQDSVAVVKDKDEEKETTTTTTDDSWVARELNEIAEQKQDDDVKGAVVQEVNEELDSSEQKKQPDKENGTKDENKNKLFSLTSNRWIQNDMAQTGRAEHSKEDWVAQDMNKVGKRGTDRQQHVDWIAQDVKHAGEVNHMPAQTAKASPKHKTSQDLIADDMKIAGQASGKDDWVVQDMKRAGHPDEARGVANQLNKALNKQHDHAYNDVYNDMEKMGKLGSDRTARITAEMQQLGRAQPDLGTRIRDTSYKFKVKHSAYDVDWIRKDMEDAGHAESRDWVARDLKFTGQDHTRGGPVVTQKKELSDYLVDKERFKVVQDVTEAGRGFFGFFRKSAKSKEDVNTMVAEDIKSLGRNSSTDWVARDMELTGHGTESKWNKQIALTSHKQRETEEVLKTRKPKLAAVEVVPVTEKPPFRRRIGRFIVRAAKKIVMPWKAWKNL
jgi:hypothetical protein